MAIRLSTDSNVYSPSLTTVKTKRTDDMFVLTSKLLSAAGGQIETEGTLELIVRKAGDRYIVTGKGTHPTEKCLSLIVLLKGIHVNAIVSESDNMGKHHYHATKGIEPLHYPGREATMPLAVIETGGEDWFILSKDKKVRQKSFAAYFDGSTKDQVIAIAHREDRRAWKHEIELPEWHIGHLADRTEIVAERCRDLETGFGHTPFVQDPSVSWVDDIKIVVNFHGEHWTGHVFNTFSSMEEQLRWLCKQIDGKHLLAFLPAWDGRYYCTYPEHQPSPRMGGADGLKRFVDTAHSLGVKVVPMLGGPNLAGMSFLAINGMTDATLKTEAGFPMLQDWVDWNSDLVRENMGYIVNFGHPSFNRYMIESAAALLENYRFDGLFLDGAVRWSNAPDYSPFEGLIKWAEAIRSKYPEVLLMAEDGYDALWSHFRLFATSWGPLGLNNAMLRYTRQTEYLAYPAENGSSGVHEVGYRWPYLDKSIKDKTIPTIALFHDTIERYGTRLLSKIEQYKMWNLHAGSNL